MLWKAITYRLFAGGYNPKMSLRLRTVSFVGGLVILSALAYKLTPRLVGAYTSVHVLALVYAVSFFGVMTIGTIADNYQRAFLAKLRILVYLSVKSIDIRRAYLYACAPIHLIALAIILPVTLKAFSDNMPWPGLLLMNMTSCAGAILYDTVLRLARLPVIVSCIFRASGLVCAAFLSRVLFVAGVQGSRWAGATAVCAVVYMVCTAVLARRPVRDVYETARLPIRQAKPTLFSELFVRAIRVMRYVGANILLLIMTIGVLVLSISSEPVLSLDGAVMITMLLIGTLAQEARAMSRRRYPIELVMYGMPGRWLTATWLLGIVNGLLCIGVCLVAIWRVAPGGLAIGFMQAASVGLGFISAGIVAGSIVVPQKQDILAQCASTAVYGALAWAVIKVFSAIGQQPQNFVLAAVLLLVASLAISYVCEKIRWLITIRRKYVYRLFQ